MERSSESDSQAIFTEVERVLRLGRLRRTARSFGISSNHLERLDELVINGDKVLADSGYDPETNSLRKDEHGAEVISDTEWFVTYCTLSYALVSQNRRVDLLQVIPRLYPESANMVRFLTRIEAQAKENGRRSRRRW